MDHREPILVVRRTEGPPGGSLKFPRARRRDRAANRNFSHRKPGAETRIVSRRRWRQEAGILTPEGGRDGDKNELEWQLLISWWVSLPKLTLSDETICREESICSSKSLLIGGTLCPVCSRLALRSVGPPLDAVSNPRYIFPACDVQHLSSQHSLLCHAPPPPPASRRS